ncbi:MAG: hypothetical protein KF727_11145 [Microbacteriaceae bacterium]|nr:hypothetical protein [Microbacteriaceae bacterium]
MSDTSDSGKTPKPIFNPDDVVEPDDAPPAEAAASAAEKGDKPAKSGKKSSKAAAADESDAAATATGQVDAADAPAPTGEGTTAEGTTAEAPASDFAGREVVYVQAPIPPRLRGNRGVGSLLAVLGAVLFGAVYAGAMIVAFVLRGAGAPMDAFAAFIQNAAFWVPVLLFLVAFVLLVLLVNRAGWAAHVFGSLLVALVVYFGSIGLLLLLGQIVGAASGEQGATFAGIATQPFLIIAALVAREVAIWVGLAISARGRRVKARNVELVDEWEREHADTKARYEQAGATA